jgi:hypothetical protein
MKAEMRQLKAKYEQLYIAKMVNPAPAAAQDASIDVSVQVKYRQSREELHVLRTQIAKMKERISDFDHFSSVVEIMALAYVRDSQENNELDRCFIVPQQNEQSVDDTDVSHNILFLVVLYFNLC